MNINDLEEILDIGIPCYDPIDFSIGGLAANASINRMETIKKREQVKEEATSRLEQVIGVKKNPVFNNLISNVLVCSDNESSKQIITLDKLIMVNNLYKELIDTTYIDGKDKNNKEVVNRLREFRERVSYVRRHAYSTEIHNGLKKDFNAIYYNRLYGEDLRYYLSTVLEYYEAIFSNIKDVYKIETRDLLEDFFKFIDVRKASVFLIRQYMGYVRVAANNNDIISAQKYLFIVTSFMKNKLNRNIINETRLDETYKQLFKDFPGLRKLDLSRKVFETNDYESNQKVIEALMNMDKKCVNTFFVKGGHTGETKEEGITRTRHMVTEEERNEIEDYINYKIYSYLVLEPVMQLEPSSNFKNYTAYLYPNGQIIADRIYNVNTVSEMKADAAYVFDVINFPELSRYTKTTLRGKVPRIIHTDSFYEKVREVVNKPTTPELQSAVRRLSR